MDGNSPHLRHPYCNGSCGCLREPCDACRAEYEKERSDEQGDESRTKRTTRKVRAT
jgi:hypothetical protein